jgi:hypothetical protein
VEVNAVGIVGVVAVTTTKIIKDHRDVHLNRSRVEDTVEEVAMTIIIITHSISSVNTRNCNNNPAMNIRILVNPQNRFL